MICYYFTRGWIVNYASESVFLKSISLWLLLKIIEVKFQKSLKHHGFLFQDDIQPVLAVGMLSEANRRLMEPGDLLESDDDNSLLLFETACQLREDAFVTLVHISVQVYSIVVTIIIDDIIYRNCVS